MAEWTACALLWACQSTSSKDRAGKLQKGDPSGDTNTDVCSSTSGVQAVKGERALQVWSDEISSLLSLELFLFECSYLSSPSFKIMQIFVLLQKCRYCSSAGTNQMSSLVYSEQYWKILWKRLLSNLTLKIVPISREHILFFFCFENNFPFPLFLIQLNFWHFIFIFLWLKLHTIVNIMNAEVGVSAWKTYRSHTKNSSSKGWPETEKKCLKSRGLSSQTARILK